MRFNALPRGPERSRVLFMMQRSSTDSLKFIALLCGLLLRMAAPGSVKADPLPAAVTAFNTYVGSLEARLTQQHRSPDGFLAPLGTESEARLRRGELIVVKLTPASGADLPGAMLH